MNTKECLGFIAIVVIALFVMLTGIDNMPPSRAELRGEIPAGPINPAYKKDK